MNKVYKKFNSFLDLKVKNEVNKKFFLDQLKRILDTEINRNNFSKNEKNYYYFITVFTRYWARWFCFFLNISIFYYYLL